MTELPESIYATLVISITVRYYKRNGILGVDFMMKSGLIIDFEDMLVKIK